MPIIGKINAIPYEDTLQNMKVLTEKYLHTDYIIITRSVVFISLITPVLYASELREDTEDEYVRVKRIGKGLTENDFEINLTDCKSFDFHLEPDSLYYNLLRRKQDFIMFQYSDEFDESTSDDNDPDSIEFMEGEMNQAIEDQDFPKAAELRDEISKRKRKKTK